MKFLQLDSTKPFTVPIHLQQQGDPRAAIEQAVRDGVDLSDRMIEADLTAASLQGGKFRSATFMGSLDNAKLDGADCTRAVFHRSLKNASAVGTVFAQATLNGVDASGMSADQADFRSAGLIGANLANVSARSALFDAARMVRAICAGMTVDGATVHKADVSKEQLATMATPFDDIETFAITGRTRQAAEAALAEALAVAKTSPFSFK